MARRVGTRTGGWVGGIVLFFICVIGTVTAYKTKSKEPPKLKCQVKNQMLNFNMKRTFKFVIKENREIHIKAVLYNYVFDYVRLSY